MRKHITLAALLMSTSFPVAAQEVTQSSTVSASAQEAVATPGPSPMTPAGFEGVNDLTYKGADDLEDFWVVPQSDLVISRNRSTGVLRIGYVFSPEGKDLSALLTGFEPLKIQDVISEMTSSEGGEMSDLVTLTPEPVLEEKDNSLLENAPEEVRNELLARLVERLGDAGTREEYERVVLEWREEVREELTALANDNDPARIVDDIIRDFSVPNSGSTEPSAPQPHDGSEAKGEEGNQSLGNGESPVMYELSASPGAPLTQTAPEQDEASSAYDVLSRDSRWFGVGAHDAPVVYMVVDPTCPFCSKALTELEPAVRAGEVQLRVVPAPLLSEQASEVVAGVLLSDNPAEALFENARAKTGAGGKEVGRRNFSDLPADVQSDVINNREQVIRLGIIQIPFFAWEASDGFRTLTGAPSADDFRGDNAPLVIK